MSLSSVIRYVRAIDTSSTTGAGKTGLAFGDFTAKYLTEGGTLTSLTTETITTLGTYQAPTSAAHVRIKELNNADPSKGIYEVHLHDSQVAVAGKNLWLMLSASGALIQPLWVPLADLSGRVPSALTSNGNMKSSLLEIISSTISEGAIGRIRDAWQGAWNVVSPVWTAQSVNQTGDNFAELAKVPKSDGSVTWNVTAAAQIQSLADAAIKGFWTATTGTVDPTGATTTTFRTNLTAVDDHYKDGLLWFESGAPLADAAPRIVLQSLQTNGQITLSEPLTSIPGAVNFRIVKLHAHPVVNIQSGLATGTNLATVNTLVTAIKAITDAIGSTAATRLGLMFSSARLITVDNTTFTPTTTQFETDQTTDASERYTEQVLFGLDGNNAGVTTPITGYAFTNSKVKLTVELLPTAPSNGHRFLIMGRIEQ